MAHGVTKSLTHLSDFTFHSVLSKGLAQNRFLVNILTALRNGRYANLARSSLKQGGYFFVNCEAEGKSE